MVLEVGHRYLCFTGLRTAFSDIVVNAKSSDGNIVLIQSMFKEDEGNEPFWVTEDSLDARYEVDFGTGLNAEPVTWEKVLST